MGSDDTHVIDPVPAVQEPESASAAKTTSSDGSGGADGSGTSSPSSRRHDDQVQNLKDKCEATDGPLGLNDNLIDETKAAPVEELEITSYASMRSSLVRTPSNSPGGNSDGSELGAWSLTQEEHVRNLKNNCRRAFLFCYSEADWADNFKDDMGFAEVVAKLRADPCLDNSLIKTNEVPFHLLHGRLLHLAVLMGDLEMVQKILESGLGPNKDNIDSFITFANHNDVIFSRPLNECSALDLAIMCGESEIVDAFLEKNAKVNTGLKGSLQLAVLINEAPEGQLSIIQSFVNKGIDIDAKDASGYTAFYVAVAKGKTDIVKELLKYKDKIRLNEAGKGGRPPIQIAVQDGFKDIESALMQCDDVKSYIGSAFRDRQVYVDAANAILVGAALIASVTFASWLQPPLNYTTSYHGSSVEYVDVEHNIALGSFWVFNTLSFYFAMGTVVFGAHSVLPRRHLFITENVKKLSQNLLLTSIFLAFSVIFVIVAFGIAGFIVLILILRYRWYMIAPTILGVIVCVGSIGYLFKSLWEYRPWQIRNRNRNRSESKRIDYIYDLEKRRWTSQISDTSDS